MEDKDGKHLFLSTSSKEAINTDSKSTVVNKVVSFMMSPVPSEESTSISKSDEVMKLNYNNSMELTSTKSVLSRIETRSTGTERSISVKNCPENIQGIDEEQSTITSLPMHQQTISDGENAASREFSVQSSRESYVPECIPPWAISVRKKYGMPLSGSLTNNYENEQLKQKLRDDIESLMKKHSDLMLVKRVESKKQFILEPSESYGQMDTIKMRAKNTRYYLAPLINEDKKQFIGENTALNHLDENKKTSLEIQSSSINKTDSSNISNRNRSLESVVTNDNDSMSITKKTSKSKAKKEISNVMKTLKITSQKSDEMQQNYTVRKAQAKCPKITLSKIREFVNAQAMDPNERTLQEIIKIEKVSPQNAQDKSKPGSKYTIVVPREKSTDNYGSVNLIKIKEKRKLRLQSIEDINEKVTELHYSQGSPRRQRGHGEYTLHQTPDGEDEQKITKRIKTPAEIKTFEVTSKRTPRIAPLVAEREETEKVLLIQYDKKTKQGKSKTKDESGPIRTTQLLGIKKPMNDLGEMYLYGAETNGSRVKENVTKVEDIPPTLKDKVYSIFEELKERAFKREAQLELTTSEMQAAPAMSAESTQRPSHPQATTEEAMVQAMPDTRSAEIQVQVSQNQLLTQEDIDFPEASPPSLVSGQLPIKQEMSSLDQSFEDIIMTSNLARIEKFEEYPEAGIKEERPEEEIIKDELKSEDDHFKETRDVKDDVLEDLYEEDTLIKDVAEIKHAGQEQEKLETISDEVEFETETQPDTIDTNEIKTKGVTFGKKTSYEEDVVTLAFSDSKIDLTESKQEEKEQQQQDKITRGPAEEQLLSSKSRTISKESFYKESYKESDMKMEPLVRLSETKRSFELSYRGADKSELFKSEIEDIRSYELDPDQGTELIIKSSSKFLNNRESIRKKMNWTEDTIYLEKQLCPKLIHGLAETAVRRPSDPISFLAHWIYKDYHNREREERQDVDREHLELTRTMMEVGAQRHEEIKKFKIRKYPIKEVDKYEDGLEGEPPEDTLPEAESVQKEVQEL